MGEGEWERENGRGREGRGREGRGRGDVGRKGGGDRWEGRMGGEPGKLQLSRQETYRRHSSTCVPNLINNVLGPVVD